MTRTHPNVDIDQAFLFEEDCFAMLFSPYNSLHKNNKGRNFLLLNPTIH